MRDTRLEEPFREPRSPAQLGVGMRRLRGRRSLNDLATEARLSRSRLSAFETGRALPLLEHADGLDAAYGGGGWVATSIRSLRRGSWDPWTLDRGARKIHAHKWQAAYEGTVWAKVVPTAEDCGHQHTLQSEWGPWVREDRPVLPSTGVVLLTGKATSSDGIAKTYNLTSDRPVFVLWGFGEALEGENVLDIRRGWRIAGTKTVPRD